MKDITLVLFSAMFLLAMGGGDEDTGRPTWAVCFSNYDNCQGGDVGACQSCEGICAEAGKTLGDNDKYIAYVTFCRTAPSCKKHYEGCKNSSDVEACHNCVH